MGCSGIPNSTWKHTTAHLHPEVGKVTIIITTTATILATPRKEEVEDGTNVNTKNTEALHGVQWHSKLHLEAYNSPPAPGGGQIGRAHV